MLLAALATFTTSPDLNTYVVNGRERGHRYSIHLRQRKFQAAGREIRMGTEDPPTWTTIDARRPWGQEYGPYLPRRELTSFVLKVDGKPVRVPRSLWWDCFEPHFTKANVQVWVSRNGRRIAVKMHNSDGGGGYSALWRFSAGQPPSREIYTDGTVLMETRTETQYRKIEKRVG